MHPVWNTWPQGSSRAASDPGPGSSTGEDPR